MNIEFISGICYKNFKLAHTGMAIKNTMEARESYECGMWKKEMDYFKEMDSAVHNGLIRSHPISGLGHTLGNPPSSTFCINCVKHLQEA